MATEVGVGFVSLRPSMDGFSKEAGPALESALTGPAQSAGDEAGSQFTSGFASGIENNIGKITVAGAVAGAALEGFARSQGDINTQLARTSTTTGIATDELRGLAKETANVTFSVNDVTDVFESLGRQGLDSADDLQRVAGVWDLVADATGENVVSLTDASVALRALGIDAAEPEQALDALGFIATETTSDVGEFLQFVERTGPELRGLGLDVNDTAAIMGVLENELGLTGRTARTEFRQAVNESNGDLGEMLDILGVTPEQFDAMRGSVEGSSDALHENAEAYEEQFTPLQRLQANVEELMLEYGGLTQAAATLAPVMIAIGPILKGITMGVRLLGLAVAANPLGLLIVAAALLVAGLMLAWQRSETFRNIVMAALNAVGSAASAVWNNVLSPFIDFMVSIPGRIGSAFSILGAVISAPFRAAFSAIRSLWNSTVGGFGFSIPDWVPGVGGREFRIPTMQEGGILTEDSLVHAHRHEAVIPLDRLEAMLAMPRGDVPDDGRGTKVENLNIQAWSDRFSLRQVQHELALHGAA